MLEQDHSRRAFLGRAAACAAAALLLPPLLPVGCSAGGEEPTQEENERSLRQAFASARRQALAGKPIGEIVAAIGLSFVGSPYIAHSLEVRGEERLVVNLLGFDCVTFVEGALSIARCVQQGKESYEAFREQLQLIRYRSGIINGYPSRLHYFTDWVTDNERKQIVRDVTRSLGGERVRSPINFMSTHRDAYRQLSDSASFAAIKEDEARLAVMERWFLPKGNIRETTPEVQTGDIVGITASIPGMDVAHTGLIVRRNTTVRFLHASMSAKHVELTEGSLAEYLLAHEKHTGILVARPLELQA